MPLFYFDVQLGTNCLPDHTGLELVTLEAADHEATRSAVEIARHQLIKLGVLHVRVTVRNERRQHLLKASVPMIVAREISQPELSPRRGASEDPRSVEWQQGQNGLGLNQASKPQHQSGFVRGRRSE
ncbi:hypothetical protein [Microvirga sp. VF16]|uniref:DUF6894 family protein n=1 Tax=Microvirga sp. VF16 TaxID=2807101 RepID=UPI00193E723A|nr:hypothetical protein [Microvirga sp. VF16]QRM33088.1 hypothetical protein JO965_27650 [Microvirga sp. VF16]